MCSTIFLLLFAAFYLLYHLSERGKVLHELAFLIRLQQKPKLSRGISVGLASVALLLCIWSLGLVPGIFGWFVALMAVACLIVLVAPFRYLRLRHVALLYGVLLMLEMGVVLR